MSIWLIAIIAMLCWSGSDIFSKIGSNQGDKYSHYKVGIAVGAIMGIHAIYSVTLGGVPFEFSDIITYLPASFFYIISMVIGYIGLRYIELSISSPICNGSGAVTALLCMITFGVTFVEENSNRVFLNTPIIIGIVLIVIGIIALGLIDNFEDPELRIKRQQTANRKYSKSILAILLPVLYCILDSCGTYVDTLIADNYFEGLKTGLPAIENALATGIDIIGETAPAYDTLELLTGDILNTAYEFTWFAVAIIFAIYVFGIKKQKVIPKYDTPKLIGGVFETIGQVFYMMVVVAGSVPGLVIISAYCAVSLVWGRIFLKEKLSWKHYLVLAAIFAGILILGYFDV